MRLITIIDDKNPDMQPSADFRGGHPQDGQSTALEEKQALDSQDVTACFNLFLGESPARASNEWLAIGSLPILLRQIFDTDQFKSSVLRPLLLREALPHTKLADTPSLHLIDWAQRTMPISAFTRRTLGGARTWAQVLELLLSDANLVALAPDLAAAEIDSLLRKRMEHEPLALVKRSVVGIIDAASAFEVRGWAVDLCDKSIPVVLEFYADGLFIGSISCHEPRPDVQDAVGGDGKFGFTFKISAAHRVRFGRGRALTVIDSVTREPVGASIVVSSDAAQSWDAISLMRNEIAQLRQALDRIEARLPEIGRLASVPIEAFDEYWERFYRPSQEVLAVQRAASEQLSYRPLVSVILPTWNSNTRLLDKAIASVRAQTYGRWELVITDDASGSDELKMLQRRHAAEPRIRWLEASSRGGIAINTNRGIAATNGDYIAFLDHDDELSPDALYWSRKAM